jgi:hypothetical protein
MDALRASLVPIQEEARRRERRVGERAVARKRVGTLIEKSGLRETRKRRRLLQACVDGRADAFALVKKQGGKPREGVTKDTGVLIVGSRLAAAR